MSERVELKPCKCECGREATKFKKPRQKYYFFGCTVCVIKGETRRTIVSAIRAWNRRAEG